jgi:hypothetical protein
MLTGCLYSVHHFNTGLILPAGRSEATVGMGRQSLWTCSQYQADSAGAAHACGERSGESVTSSAILQGSIDYRLGVKDSWGPFPGAEIQWHLEAPTNPATMEFGLNLALPGGTAFHHKAGAGWGIGAWADNSLYLEYSASRRFASPSLRNPLVFGNLRATYLATQMEDVLQSDFSEPLPSHRTLVFQAAIGTLFRLPEWILVPDFLAPQFNVTFPQLPSGEQKFRGQDIPPVQWDVNLGFGWGF